MCVYACGGWGGWGVLVCFVCFLFFFPLFCFVAVLFLRFVCFLSSTFFFFFRTGRGFDAGRRICVYPTVWLIYIHTHSDTEVKP